MSRRKSALDVSFGDETQDTPDAPPVASSSSQVLHKPLKRKSKDNEYNGPKKAKLLPACYFRLPSDGDYLRESGSMRISGEDDDELGDTPKRIRNLWEFTIFDPLHQNQFISLSSLERPDGRDCKFEAFGKVTVFVENAEDEGQEADLTDPHTVQFVHLDSILSAALDYTKEHRPLYIETQHSWYILQMPSFKYRDFLREFYLPHRLAQMLVSSALAHPQLTHRQFIDEQLSKAPALLDQDMTEADLKSAVSLIRDVVREVCTENPDIQRVPAIKFYFSLGVQSGTAVVPRRRLTAKGPNERKVNIDLAVLKPEYQTPTTVTPLVASIAQRYFRENLRVIGRRPHKDPEKKREQRNARELAHQELSRLIKHCYNRTKCKWDYERVDQIRRDSRYLKAITIDGVRYEIGDTLITPIGNDPTNHKPNARNKDEDEKFSLPLPTEQISVNQSFEDFFWFARIINIDIDLRAVHVQWFSHGNTTAMGELSHPQELFLEALCGPVAFESVVAKMKVHYFQADTKGRLSDIKDIPYGEYFCKSEYDPQSASFTTIRTEFLHIEAGKGDNCAVCRILQEEKEIQYPIGKKDAITYRGRDFHIFDYVLYQSSEDGPGNIGQVNAFVFPRETSGDPIEVDVRKLGRMTSLKKIMPENEMIDERELFYTEEQPVNHDRIHATSLIQVCHVLPTEIRSEQIENWIMHGPEHFYVRYCFPSLDVQSWVSKKPIKRREITICKDCHQKRLKEVESLNEFVIYQQKHPLRALDVFGGSGAFSTALANGSSCFDVTHVIEIAPSAAQTYRQNYPQTAVHNVCVNEAVQYIVKKHHGVETEYDIPINRATGETEEFTVKPGDTDVLVAGFPCQPHSSQNLYKDANDVKTNLILPLLSLIDVLRQRIVFLENVSGFLYCPLMGTQKERYRVEGGVKQGALKLIIRVLVEMGYQVRFSLLQAAHYGVPQGRVRFFLIATLPGTPLPELPQPTHDFPLEGAAPHLRINLTNERTIEPIQTARGTALFPLVTVADAIGDLRQFDWKHPSPLNWTAEQRREAARRRVTIPSVPCRADLPWWGLAEDQYPYEHPASSRFQIEARKQPPPPNIQHYTRKLPLKTVERVVNIKLEPGSDFRGLPPHLSEFQFWNPSSSVAKSRGIKSLYKRLDPDRCFMTTITNVSPTAKQCAVIHPFCRRLLSVRELARSQGFPDHFLFHAIDDNIITMHRCIGNAVPWQLSLALGQELKKALHEKWKMREQIVID
ncbi:S-adenosyl-L-methionine-dependent methyltransferase [Lentinula aff. detonsa]|uniref:DNA (cytosine-5-)-methyltransferase n=1 Tax=Lentinula aff. detonsa TaxID=2804958 RepID=A0AA38KG39_9AGAR|nr:S-adenosyl-L-methionine-dependent methyltransferase [Lentinula aff. detonsa]